MPRLTAFLSLFFVMAISMTAAEAADKGPAYLDGEKAGPDFKVQGEYEGKIGKDTKVGVQVIARGDGKFDAVVFGNGLPGSGWDPKQPKIHLKGETNDDIVEFTGLNFSGAVKDGIFAGIAEDDVKFELRKIHRSSPTMGLKPPEGAIVLFDGTNVDALAEGKIEDGKLLGVPVRSKQKFNNYTLHLEFRSPYMPEARGQGRGNSGMYLNDQYECQILDSFGLEGKNNECGGFYQIQEPKVNMCLPPLSWQTYDVDFQAAKFDSEGKKVTPAIVTVRQNGVVIHDKLKLPHTTPGGGQNDEKLPGSLFLQDHGDPVRFRNFWVVEK